VAQMGLGTITPDQVGAMATSDGLVAGELVKSGVVTGLSGAAAGVVTSAVVLTTPFPTNIDNIHLTIGSPSVQTLVFGGLWETNRSKTGFTINVDITTLQAGSTFNVRWVAYGH